MQSKGIKGKDNGGKLNKHTYPQFIINKIDNKLKLLVEKLRLLV